MDEVYDNLQQFQRNLEIFNGKLKASFADLQRNHEKVNPYWQDNMRREYQLYWDGLEEKMHQYVNADGDNYSEIMLHKLNLIKKYLYGD